MRKSTPAWRKQPLQAVALGQGIDETRGIALNPEGLAQPQQHAVVVELERQVLGHQVALFLIEPLQPAPALQQDDDKLVPRGRKLDGVHVRTEAAEQFAVH